VGALTVSPSRGNDDKHWKLMIFGTALEAAAVSMPGNVVKCRNARGKKAIILEKNELSDIQLYIISL
jgi:hypothetical protein